VSPPQGALTAATTALRGPARPDRPPHPLFRAVLELRERIWTYAELYPRSLTTVVIETNNGGRSGARY